jgi:hypothetical protein
VSQNDRIGDQHHRGSGHHDQVADAKPAVRGLGDGHG